jgi:hypothetical protein
MIAAAQRRRQRHRIIQGATDQQRPRQALGEAEGESLRSAKGFFWWKSLDWFKGKSTGNHGFSHENGCFP